MTTQQEERQPVCDFIRDVAGAVVAVNAVLRAGEKNSGTSGKGKKKEQRWQQPQQGRRTTAAATAEPGRASTTERRTVATTTEETGRETATQPTGNEQTGHVDGHVQTTRRKSVLVGSEHCDSNATRAVRAALSIGSQVLHRAWTGGTSTTSMQVLLESEAHAG